MNNKKVPLLVQFPIKESQKKRVAVMDLGTNTFHLLIAEGSISGYREIVHRQIPVWLGEGGINNGTIHPAAFERGVKTMQEFHQLILKHKIKQVRAIATSAIRSAANGNDLIDEVEAKTGIKIETIDGDREAEFIYKGVKAAGCLSEKTSLIIDIGGGSVEFILGNSEQLLWKQSFEIGAARLMDKFHKMDPIPSNSIKKLQAYLNQTLAGLFIAAANNKIDTLIGSSGAFETFAEVIELDKGNEFDVDKVKNYAFNYADLISMTDKLIRSSHQERVNTKGIISIRIDMIVVASLITRFVMQKLGLKKVLMSTNSLKEGVLAEMLG